MALVDSCALVVCFTSDAIIAPDKSKGIPSKVLRFCVPDRNKGRKWVPNQFWKWVQIQIRTTDEMKKISMLNIQGWVI